MASDSVRKRLENLNRRRYDAGFAERPLDLSLPGVPASADQVRPLEQSVAGSVVRIDGQSFYRIKRNVVDCWPPASAIVESWLKAPWASAPTGRGPASDRLTEIRQTGRDRLAFVDIETCGFSGTPVFLIGVLSFRGRTCFVEQMLARTYEEERGILVRFARVMGRCEGLVTFNGSTFDWPFLADRAAACHVKLPEPVCHCDLLHAARRKYRMVLPNCRLQTLETHVCGRRRSGDIPGAEIPAAYHAFVRSGDARQVREILQHNFLDLVTMVDIMSDLLE